jgi:uncharacterized alpha-E superfamily protein
MLSRDADASYWIGRYVERAEATARMIDVHYHAALESGSNPLEEEIPIGWNSLLTISGGDELFAERFGTANDRDVLYFFSFDRENPDSIISLWENARANARSIREQLASEMWETLNISWLNLREWDIDRILAGTPHTFFQQVKDASHLFQGILNRTMLMGETRDWLDTGRFLERGGQTARLLDVKYHDLLPAYRADNSNALKGQEDWGVGGLADMHSWIAILKSVSAFEMYRKTYRGGIRPDHIIDFLVLHPQFPASVRHCLARVEGCLRRISGNSANDLPNPPERLLGRLNADLNYSRPQEIVQTGLHQYLERVLDECDAIGDAITQQYLSY